MTITLFNNLSYFNRKIAVRQTLLEYNQMLGNTGASFSGVDFKMLDGVRTSQVVNYSEGGNPDFFDGTESPSYLVVSEDGDDWVSSRWWVVDCVINRYGQATLSLLRDVIADNYNTILTTTSFVEKGWVTSTQDPAIFNNEDMSFNQIKQSETLLKDKSQSAYYALYVSKDYGKDSQTGEYVDQTVSLPRQVVHTNGTFDTEDEYTWSQYTSSSPFKGTYEKLYIELYGYDYNGPRAGSGYVFTWDGNGQAIVGEGPENYYILGQTGVRRNPDAGQVGFRLKSYDFSKIFERAAGKNWVIPANSITGAKGVPTEAENELFAQNGRLIRVGGVAKKVIVHQRTTSLKRVDLASISTGSLRSMMWDVAALSNQFYTDQYLSTQKFTLAYSINEMWITLETIEEPQFAFTISRNRQHTIGVPYDLWAIPATYSFTTTSKADYDSSTSPVFSKEIISALQQNIAKELLFDIQLVPYCPLEDTFLSNGEVLDTLLAQDAENLVQFQTIALTDEPYTENTYIIYALNNEFKKRLQGGIELPSDTLSYKVSNECDMYRLVSPNYNGQFEFSAAKNGGVEHWNLTFTYKPYSPYIHVSPKFGRLYGSDFRDARGLICGGDFSISQISEAWESYELQNKNYQNIFDRQIQNMEVNNSVQRIKEGTNIFTGTLTGVTSGAMTGAMVGSGYGAAAGAIVGGVSSVAGGIADMALNEKLRQESLDYAKDNFGYQLQNIQALPYSLTKVGSQNVDFKYFPFVETYSCTDTEKQALRDKCKWNGMTIMRIGQIQEFMSDDTDTGTFIKARPIRLMIAEDSHITDVIAAELQTGVYLT